jgi:hypothetical protein
MNSRIAGPTLNALVAASMSRMLIQKGEAFSGAIGDPARSGVYREEVNGVTVTTTNFVNVVEADVESRLTWEIAHASWTLRFTERRMLESGNFEKAAPYTATLEGDLIDAARFLALPKELFFGAVRADGWSPAQIAIERLRWLDLPYICEGARLNAVLRLL